MSAVVGGAGRRPSAKQVLTDATPCTLTVGSGEPCGRVSWPGLPMPVCGEHATAIYRAVAGLVDERRE